MLGLWIEQTEGAKFWLRVMTELKNRGVEVVLVAVVDGLQGFPEAITTVLLRYSLNFVTWQHRKAVAAGLKAIYRAPTAEAARAALEAFAASEWGRKYPPIARRGAAPSIIPMPSPRIRVVPVAWGPPAVAPCPADHEHQDAQRNEKDPEHVPSRTACGLAAHYSCAVCQS